MQARDEAKRCHRPGHDRDLLLFQIGHQRSGLREQRARHHHQRATAGKGAVDVLHRHIEIEGSLVGHTIGFLETEQAHEVVDEIDDRAMADGNAFGCAGRARGEQHVRGIGIDNTRAGTRKQRLVHQVIKKIFSKKNLRQPSAFADLLGRIEREFIGNNERILQDPDDARQSLSGHLRIHGDVKSARAQRAEHDAERIDALFHINDHRPVTRA